MLFCVTQLLFIQNRWAYFTVNSKLFWKIYWPGNFVASTSLQLWNSLILNYFVSFFVYLIWGRLKLHFRQYSRNIFTLSPVGSWFIVHVCTWSSLDGMRHLNDVTLNVILYVNDVNITLSVVNKMLSVFSLVNRWLHEEIEPVSWHNHQIHSQTFKWPKY